MRLHRFLTATLSTWLALVSGLQADTYQLDRLNGAAAERCRLVRFPGPWQPPGTGLGFGPRIDIVLHELQFSTVGDSGTVFVAAVAKVPPFKIDPVHYSANRFRLDLGAPGEAVRPVPEAEWPATAPRPLHRYTNINRFGNRDRNLPTLPHASTQFARTGRQFMGCTGGSMRLSPQEGLLAALSYTGSASGETVFGAVPLPPLPWSGPRGRFYVDLYDVASGRVLVQLAGRYRGGEPTGASCAAGWLSERFFLLPLGDRLDLCLVCDFGDRVGAAPGKRP